MPNARSGIYLIFIQILKPLIASIIAVTVMITDWVNLVFIPFPNSPVNHGEFITGKLSGNTCGFWQFRS